MLNEENEDHLNSLYAANNQIVLGCFEAYQKDSSLSSLLESLLICCRLLIEESENMEGSEEKSEQEDAQDNNEGDNSGDYIKVKEHMHMVLARYAKEGIIDYKEAAQIHSVSFI
jgi:hypothetical protein